MALLAPHHPGFFEVLARPRSYTTLLYLLGSLVTGILAFTFTVTGLSLSLGLAILIIGLPIALAFLMGSRLLALGELHVLALLVDEDPLPLPALLPPGVGFLGRLKTLLGDRRTWTGLLYFLLQLPLGILHFTVLFTLLVLGLVFVVVPAAVLLQAMGLVALDLQGLAWSTAHPGLSVAVLGLLGILLVPLTFHLALLMGRFQVWLARHLLIQP